MAGASASRSRPPMARPRGHGALRRINAVGCPRGRPRVRGHALRWSRPWRKREGAYADRGAGGVHHWPGVNTLRALLDKEPIVVKRPRHFFSDDMPEEVTLHFTIPPSTSPGGPRPAHACWAGAPCAPSPGAAARRRTSRASAFGRRSQLGVAADHAHGELSGGEQRVDHAAALRSGTTDDGHDWLAHTMSPRSRFRAAPSPGRAILGPRAQAR